MSRFEKVMLAGLLVLMAFMYGIEFVEARMAEESIITYKVQAGDTVWSIADRFYPETNIKMSFDEYSFKLHKMNEKLQPMNDYGKGRKLQPGDVVQVPVWKVKK